MDEVSFRRIGCVASIETVRFARLAICLNRKKGISAFYGTGCIEHLSSCSIEIVQIDSRYECAGRDNSLEWERQCRSFQTALPAALQSSSTPHSGNLLLDTGQ